MKIAVVHPSELGEPELARWRGFQRAVPSLANPFLSPEFTVAVGRLRPRTRVAVLSEGADIVGFFPFERRGLGYGVPIAPGLTDCQGLVHVPEAEWDPYELLRACRLAVWEFDRLVHGQQPFEQFVVLRAPSPIIDLTKGADAVLSRLRKSSARFVDKLPRQQRKLAREVGELRFVFGTQDHAALHTLMAWKSAQYRRTGRTDRFTRPWIVQLLQQLLDQPAEHFSLVLSTLYAGDEPVAAHLGLRMDHVLAGWFPAYDPRFAKYSPGLLHRLHLLRAAETAGIRRIDLGRGAKEHKELFKSADLFVSEGRVLRRCPTAVLHWARRAPVRRLRNIVLAHPVLYRMADQVLKKYGSLHTQLGGPNGWSQPADPSTATDAPSAPIKDRATGVR